MYLNMFFCQNAYMNSENDISNVYLNISVHKSFGLSFTNISAFVISLARSQYLANQLLFSPRVVTSYLCVPNEKIRPGKRIKSNKI